MGEGDLRQRVLEASEDWVWVPPDAQDVTTADYRLTHYPWSTSVQWSRTSRPVDELFDEVRDRAREAGHSTVRWWVRDSSTPAGTDRALEALGFELVETVDVFALDLRAGVDAVVDRLDAPQDVTVSVAVDEAALLAVHDIRTETLGDPPATPEQLAHALAVAAESARTGRWSERQWLASVETRPVGQAGATLVGPVARLWGGGVLEGARGRGVYRALLATRLQATAEVGAELALVKGRVATSAPVLRRAGFSTYGQERCFQTAL